MLRGEDNLWPPSRVLIAGDSSEDAGKAGEMTVSIGGLFGATGALGRSTRVYWRPSGRTVPWSPAWWTTSSGGPGRSCRARKLEGLLGRPVNVRLVAYEGADGIDGIAMTLISVGSRGLGRIRRARMGSVSSKVVRAADGLVLVYPHGWPRPAIRG